jgi:hypothetical protein
VYILIDYICCYKILQHFVTRSLYNIPVYISERNFRYFVHKKNDKRKNHIQKVGTYDFHTLITYIHQFKKPE